MTKIISIASQKGGVGKTTTALNISYLLSMMGEKVLLIDADPQGGIAISSNLTRRTSLGIIDMIEGNAGPDDVVAPVKGTSLSIAGVGVMEPEKVMAYETAARSGALGELIRKFGNEGEYDYVVVDSPAGVGEVVRAALCASDGGILAIRPRNLSLKSIPPFLKLVKWIKSNCAPDFRLEGVVVTMYDDKNPFEREVLAKLKKIIPEELFYKTIIPFNDLFERASMKALPIALVPEAKKVARSYKELALEIKAREPLFAQKGTIDENAEGLF